MLLSLWAQNNKHKKWDNGNIKKHLHCNWYLVFVLWEYCRNTKILILLYMCMRNDDIYMFMQRDNYFREIWKVSYWNSLALGVSWIHHEYVPNQLLRLICTLICIMLSFCFSFLIFNWHWRHWRRGCRWRRCQGYGTLGTVTGEQPAGTKENVQIKKLWTF